jgi:WD40 repeat protein
LQTKAKQSDIMDTSSNPQIIEHISHSVSYTPFQSVWIPCSAKILTLGCYARGSGALQILELDGNKLKVISEAEKKDGLKCCTFGASSYESRHIATGSYGGQLAMWDIERLSAEPVYSVPKAHSSLINSIDGCGGLNIGSGAPEIVTGGRDGCVKVWDIRQAELPVASLEPADSNQGRDCWTVAFGNSFNDSERVVVSGYDNGDIKLFCLRTNKLLFESNVNNGVVGLQFDRKDIPMNKLIVTTLESKFRVYDMRTLHPKEGYSFLTEKAHNSTVWAARHLPQNRDIFVTTGGNGTVNLYKYNYPDQRVIKDAQDGSEKGVLGSLTLLNNKKFSDQPIVSFDWSMDKQGLCTMTALDQTVKVAVVTKLNAL